MNNLTIDVVQPILEELDRSGGYIDYVTLLNHLSISPASAQQLLKFMSDKHLIYGTFTAYSSVRLEPNGHALLLQLRRNADQQRQKDTAEKAQKEADNANVIKDKKKQFRHDFLVAAFAAIISSSCTLLLEHIDEIVQWIRTLLS